MITDLNREINEQYDQLTAFEKQKAKNALTELQKLYMEKNAKLHNTNFEFFGDPIPPPSTISIPAAEHKHQEVKPLLEQLRLQKSLIDHKVPHMLVSDINQCILTNWDTSPVYSAHLKYIENSVIKIRSNGPVIAENVHNSLLVVDCHQFRLHNATNCTVVPRTGGGRMVIECCKELRIAPTDSTYVSVDDFSWPTADKPNPHFTFVEQVDHSWTDEIAFGGLKPQDLNNLLTERKTETSPTNVPH